MCGLLVFSRFFFLLVFLFFVVILVGWFLVWFYFCLFWVFLCVSLVLQSVGFFIITVHSIPYPIRVVSGYHYTGVLNIEK